MHMADALISPVVGTTMIVANVGVAAYSVKKIQNDLDDKKIPLMGVMGAFIFAVQMINFAIPGTGSSGHLAGGILLAIVLGPYGGFLTMAAVLIIQALFFGDGGLLALGCNIFNLGFFTCFVTYPLVYKKITNKALTSVRIFVGSLLAAIVGLQLGSFFVVLETFLSGKTELPFGTFLILMQPIHLVIGIVEGLITAAIVTFLWKARPEILESNKDGKKLGNVSIKKVLIAFLVLSILIGAGLSIYASKNPDGLEWSMEKILKNSELEVSSNAHNVASKIQEKTTILPGYSLGDEKGKSFAAILGVILTIAAISLITAVIVLIKKRKKE